MPAFANTYFKRFQAELPLIAGAPHADLFLTVVIPCHNEPDLIRSLQSLKDCEIPQSAAEVIVVINASETDRPEVIEQNRKTISQTVNFIRQYSSERMRFYVLNFEDLPAKFAGVGMARKIGMDEALHRYNRLNRPEGLIIGFDADSTVEPNYFTETEKLFRSKPKTKACSIRFEHPISGTEQAPEIYRSIIDYELHLRYFVEALRYAGLPFAYHTIGSAFAVRADVYAAQGGMNKKKAGEDFYFLQKIIPLGKYEELNTTCVYPSPRVSDRVPFGTGAAVRKMTESKSTEYLTYRFESFTVLKSFFLSIDDYYTGKEVAGLDPSLEAFLKMNDFEVALCLIRKNGKDLKSFRNRFFLWFNAFRTMKYLNFAHETHFQRQPVRAESLKLLKYIQSDAEGVDCSEKLLLLYREKSIIINC